MPGIPHHGLMPSLYPIVTRTSPRPLHDYPPACQTQRAESEVDVGVVYGYANSDSHSTDAQDGTSKLCHEPGGESEAT